MTTLITEIVAILVAGLTAFGEGFFGAMSTIMTNIFMVPVEGGGTQMSTFGIIIITFAGISLCVGLTRWITSFVTSLGN